MNVIVTELVRRLEATGLTVAAHDSYTTSWTRRRLVSVMRQAPPVSYMSSMAAIITLLSRCGFKCLTAEAS